MFGACYEFHLASLKSNARLLAIPTAEVDHQAWITRLEHYAEWGLSVLNVAAFFVPGLGEVMLAVTAVQLTCEVYQGVQAWQEADAEEAWGHFSSVLQNVAFMAVLGAVASKAPAITPSRFVNGMTRITTPFGEPRLWSPDLAPYKSSVALDGLEPDALGQFKVGDRTYIRQEGNVYEKTFDPALQQWRIKHPADPQAYQPILRHNQLGAWRHTLERPLEWDRPTLLRRMGPQMDEFSEAQLQQIAEVSGVSDDALRQMHIDHRPPPPLLAETIRWFRTDRQVNGLTERIRNGNALGSAYVADIERLQRSFPSLSPEGARQVLSNASVGQLDRLRSSDKVPVPQARDIRAHLQQSALNRAICGLHLQDMASVASDRLALHGLEQLPGWSADSRVEMRAGSIRGPLLDSIGSDSAPVRHYLVRGDGFFRAYDAQGRVLNNLPTHGRNLFESLLEFLPEASRVTLEGDQAKALQNRLANYASAHRNQMSLILKQRPLNGSGPSLRLPDGRLGYLASGRGVGFGDSAWSPGYETSTRTFPMRKPVNSSEAA